MKSAVAESGTLVLKSLGMGLRTDDRVHRDPGSLEQSPEGGG